MGERTAALLSTNVALFSGDFGDSSPFAASADRYLSIYFADLDGDGFADVCGRDGTNLVCALNRRDHTAGAATAWLANFGSTWSTTPAYWSTIQYPDLDGDGKADVCGRGAAGLYCARSTGAAFTGLSLVQSQLSDALGWTQAQYYETLSFVDVSGDGRPDLCARGPGGIQCAVNNSGSFGAFTTWAANLSDGNGWNQPQYYEAIRYADVNGDGRIDLCARGGAGIYCFLNGGSSFGAPVLWSGEFSDALGYNQSGRYQTMRLADIDGDGKADVCMKAGEGMRCARSTGSGFAQTVLLPSFADAYGWSSASYWRTFQLVDVNGDRRADLCARGANGILCAYADGSSALFAALQTPVNNFGDNFGWGSAERYWGTVQPADIGAGAGFEICGRGGAGIYCTPGPEPVPVARTFNGSSDRLFTTNADEAIGSGQDVESFRAFYVARNPALGLTPLYRCYSNTHYYSTSPCPSGWVSEGVLGYISTSYFAGVRPLYQLQGPGGDNLYTSNNAELSASGYVYRGIVGYVWDEPPEPCTPADPNGPANAQRGFVTRTGDKLYDGARRLRFASFNVPTLLLEPNYTFEPIEDETWEKDDLLRSIVQLGGQVVRTFTFTTQSRFPDDTGLQHHVSFDAAGHVLLNERMFQSIDRSLDLANRYGLRLIVPFADEDKSRNPDWPDVVNGGIYSYLCAAYQPNPCSTIRNDWPTTPYNDVKVRNLYKRMIDLVLDRTNTQSCVRYKNDPAVLAWETGNELRNQTTQWTEQVAAFVKSNSPRALVVDGAYGIRSDSLSTTSSIDIVSDHFYGNTCDNFSTSCLYNDAATATGKKPFVAGELGANSGGNGTTMMDFLDAAYYSNTTGILLWALRPHSYAGGFGYLCDEDSDFSSAYHWPGFDVGYPRFFMPDELQVLKGLQWYAPAMAGNIPPSFNADLRQGTPDVPCSMRRQVSAAARHNSDGTLAGFDVQLYCSGSTGADAYVIERSNDGATWSTRTSGAKDSVPQGVNLFLDQPSAAESGVTYFYRVRAAFNFRDGRPAALSAPSLPMAVTLTP